MDPRHLTRAVHGGTHGEALTGAVITPIFQTSTFVQKSPGEHSGYDYSRGTNPTRSALELSLAALEEAKHALAFSSGLAAEQAVLQTLEPEADIIVCDDVYGGTGRLFRTLFQKYKFRFHFVDMSKDEEILSILSPKTKMIWVETPTNPMMKVIDLAKMKAFAQKVQALLVVDNTFASPIFQSPLKFGADIVVHSTTKYIGGHSDLIGGALMLNNDELYEKLKFVQFAAGAVPGPFECFLLQRSIRTLAIRMQQHHINTQAVAEFLSDHPKIHKVHFPGLKTHPQHELAKKQMSGFSGMLSMEMKGGYEDVLKFISKLRIFCLAESLGAVESLVNHPERMTHASVPPEMRKKLGIGPNLVRLSIGIESASDLIEDLKTALI